MIECRCSSKDTALITQMKPFQGALKKRNDKDIAALKESLLSEGLLMPFALWDYKNAYYILDGHGRYSALIKASFEDSSILTQEFPAILITAPDENEAKKALSQIISTYGKVDKAGLIDFTASITGYKAPILKSLSKAPKLTVTSKGEYDIIKLRVPKDKSLEVRKLFEPLTWLEVL